MNIQSLYPASSPPLLGFPEKEQFLNTILILFLKFWNLEKLTEVEFNLRELIKVFRVVDCRHIDWKSCRPIPEHKREIVIVGDEGGGFGEGDSGGEGDDDSPLRIPLYNVENNCKIVERRL